MGLVGGEILWTCEQGFFGLVGGVSLDSWAELLQTYRQSSAGLRYAFHWTRGQSLFGLMSGASPDSWAEFLQTRGRSYFGLMGGASSEAWMNLDFTDVSLSFPSSLQRSSSSSSSFLLFWLEQQRRVFAIQEAGVIRGGGGGSLRPLVSWPVYDAGTRLPAPALSALQVRRF